MTLEDNLYLNEKHTPDDMVNMLMNRLDLKLEDNLGQLDDNGRELSGGEWQSIAFTRCLLRDKSIIVLDEPTSSLDSFTEEKYLKLLRNKSKNRTVKHNYT